MEKIHRSPEIVSRLEKPHCFNCVIDSHNNVANQLPTDCLRRKRPDILSLSMGEREHGTTFTDTDQIIQTKSIQISKYVSIPNVFKVVKSPQRNLTRFIDQFSVTQRSRHFDGGRDNSIHSSWRGFHLILRSLLWSLACSTLASGSIFIEFFAQSVIIYLFISRDNVFKLNET